MHSATSAEHLSAAQDVVYSSVSSIKVCLHTVRIANTDVRAMRAGAALVRAGFEVSMLDIGAEDASTAEEEREGICIKHLPVSKAFFATRFKGWSLFRAI